MDGVAPVDQQPAPNHHEQHREVHPVKPPDREGMFPFQYSHRFSPSLTVGYIGGTTPFLPASTRSAVNTPSELRVATTKICTPG